jgi:hypothetical protein
LPSKFATADLDLLHAQLLFLLPDRSLITDLSACFLDDPTFRPSIQMLKKTIQLFRKTQLAEPKTEHVRSPLQIDKVDLEVVINKSIKGLASPIMLTEQNLWWSKMAEETALAYYQSERSSICGGFHVGASGILFLLARTHKAGISIRPCLDAYTQSWRFIRKHYLNRVQETPAGLYAGTAGIALALTEGLESGLLKDKEQTLLDMQACLKNENTQGLGITKGISGQGIVLLRAASVLGDPFIKPVLEKHVKHLLETQEKDGSWLITTDDGKRHLKITGFGHGVAGIACFLLDYAGRYNDTHAQQGAARALHWLMRQARTSGNRLVWRLDDKSRQSDPGMHEGWTGIISAFIKGYELVQEPAYRLTAETALRNYPPYIIARDLTLSSGLAGLGEVYLEACRVLKTGEWQQRANWIVQIL